MGQTHICSSWVEGNRTTVITTSQKRQRSLGVVGGVRRDILDVILQLKTDKQTDVSFLYNGCKPLKLCLFNRHN